MGNRIEAKGLVEELIAGYKLPEADVIDLFRDVPLDFPIFFRKRLPFRVNRFGMIGITLRGRVWLLEKIKTGNPIWLLGLIRHEAEHVRQQRLEPLLFYPRYLLYWLGNFLNPLPSTNLRDLRKRYTRTHGAYRAIPYEIAAYGAGDHLKEILHQFWQK